MEINHKSKGDSCNITVLLAAEVLRGLGSTVSERARVLLTEDPRALLDLEVNPLDYEDASRFAVDYLSVSLMSKFDSFDIGVDRVAAALEKFRSAEESCKQARLNLLSLRRGEISFLSPLHWVFHSARVKIERALGPFSWDLASQYFSFGPGACIGIPRRKSDGHYKYGCLKPSVTEACADLAVACISRNREWKNHLSQLSPDPASWFTYVAGNRVTTVPKNAKTDRIIAIEPQMNMYVQKGIGGLMRRRLRRVGVDLNDQTSNQRLAREASISGGLATIDLSSASDTVSLALVEELLPVDWVEAIKLCRSPVGDLPSGERIVYRKVSSMGNGFTFELESLIFWALSESVVDFLELSDRRVGVYGDDIVVATEAVTLLQEVLEFAGFKFNGSKSFWKGNFRESCGKHYFSGTDVTPFYIRTGVDTRERLIWLANSIRVMAWRLLGSDYGLDGRLEQSWRRVLSRLPRDFVKRHRGPLWLNGQMSDHCIGVDFDESRPILARKSKISDFSSWDGFLYMGFKRIHAKKTKCDLPSFIRWVDVRGLRESCEVPPCEGVSFVEYSTSRYKLCTVKCITPQWAGTGPWIAV